MNDLARVGTWPGQIHITLICTPAWDDSRGCVDERACLNVPTFCQAGVISKRANAVTLNSADTAGFLEHSNAGAGHGATGIVDGSSARARPALPNRQARGTTLRRDLIDVAIRIAGHLTPLPARKLAQRVRMGRLAIRRNRSPGAAT